MPPSPGRRRTRPPGSPNRSGLPKTRRPSPKPIEILYKCSSEPLLPATADGDESCGSCRSSDSDGFFRLHTFNDIFSSPPEFSFSPLRPPFAGHEKDSKVLITVTVEGSPGPIRMLIKLGTSVEDTIKLVLQKYVQEGRTPRLEMNAASAFDLHISYFSFQSLERSNTIGDIDSRNFYLRRISRKGHGESQPNVVITPLSHLPAVVAIDENSLQGPRLSSMVVMPSFITRKFSKIVRRMRKLFKVFGCLQSR